MNNATHACDRQKNLQQSILKQAFAVVVVVVVVGRNKTTQA